MGHHPWRAMRSTRLEDTMRMLGFSHLCIYQSKRAFMTQVQISSLFLRVPKALKDNM